MVLCFDASEMVQASKSLLMAFVIHRNLLLTTMGIFSRETIILIPVILQGLSTCFPDQIQAGECITNTLMIEGHGIENASGCHISGT